MRPLALLFRAVAMSIAGAAAAAAADYVDQNAQFRFTVPDGWQVAAPTERNDRIALVAAFSPRIAKTSGLCLFASASVAETASMSQQQLNEGMQSQIDEAFWRELMKDNSVKDVALLESTTELKNGRRGYYATARLTTVFEGKDHPEQQFMALFLVPGRMHMAQCSVDVAEVAAEEADIKTIISSFEPTGGAIVSSLQPRQTGERGAALVLYSGPKFDGAKHELTHDAPSLAHAGWNAVTASFGVRGYGVWQVCDRPSYQGNCRVLAGADAHALGGQALRIASARRLVDPRNPLSALGIVRDNITEVRKVDPHHLVRRR